MSLVDKVNSLLGSPVVLHEEEAKGTMSNEEYKKRYGKSRHGHKNTIAALNKHGYKHSGVAPSWNDDLERHVFKKDDGSEVHIDHDKKTGKAKEILYKNSGSNNGQKSYASRLSPEKELDTVHKAEQKEKSGGKSTLRDRAEKKAYAGLASGKVNKKILDKMDSEGYDYDSSESDPNDTDGDIHHFKNDKGHKMSVHSSIDPMSGSHKINKLVHTDEHGTKTKHKPKNYAK